MIDALKKIHVPIMPASLYRQVPFLPLMPCHLSWFHFCPSSSPHEKGKQWILCFLLHRRCRRTRHRILPCNSPWCLPIQVNGYSISIANRSYVSFSSPEASVDGLGGWPTPASSFTHWITSRVLCRFDDWDLTCLRRMHSGLHYSWIPFLSYWLTIHIPFCRQNYSHHVLFPQPNVCTFNKMASRTSPICKARFALFTKSRTAWTHPLFKSFDMLPSPP